MRPSTRVSLSQSQQVRFRTSAEETVDARLRGDLQETLLLDPTDAATRRRTAGGAVSSQRRPVSPRGTGLSEHSSRIDPVLAGTERQGNALQLRPEDANPRHVPGGRTSQLSRGPSDAELRVDRSLKAQTPGSLDLTPNDRTLRKSASNASASALRSSTAGRNGSSTHLAAAEKEVHDQFPDEELLLEPLLQPKSSSKRSGGTPGGVSMKKQIGRNGVDTADASFRREEDLTLYLDPDEGRMKGSASSLRDRSSRDFLSPVERHAERKVQGELGVETLEVNYVTYCECVLLFLISLLSFHYCQAYIYRLFNSLVVVAVGS